MFTRSEVLSRAVAAVPVVLIAAALWGAPAQDAPDTRAIEFPDVGSWMTLAVDLHTHSVFSDGEVWPSIRVQEAVRDGLAAYAVTEHLEYQPHLEDIPNPDRNRAFRVAVAEADGSPEVLVIPGVEITRFAPIGHMNAVFVQDANTMYRIDETPEPYDRREYWRRAAEWPAQQAVDAANAQGAFVFWNHPWTEFEDRIVKLTEFHQSNIQAGKLHGVEVVTGGRYMAEAFQLALDHDLTMLGDSDIHSLIDWDYPPQAGRHRPATLVFAEERTGPAIRQALFDKRTVVWWNNLLLGRPRELLPLLEACLTAGSGRYGGAPQLTVTLTNSSDARFQLRSRNPFSMPFNFDIIEVPPHGQTDLRLRTGTRLEHLDLEFEVLNALVAPNEHPVITLSIDTGAPRPR